MARLRDEDIRRMSPVQAEAYTKNHPAEAWRFAKIFGKEAAEQTKVAISYRFHTGTYISDSIDTVVV